MTEIAGGKTIEELQKLEEELDSEVSFRALLPKAAFVVGGLLLTLSLFHYYTAGFGLLREKTHRGIHMAFVLGLIFLVFPAFRSKSGAAQPQASLFRPLGISVIDWLSALAVCVAALYVPWIFDDLAFKIGNPAPIDVFLGSLLIILLLEATRRSVGWALPAIAIGMMLYALYGRSMPGILVHPGATWKGLVDHLYLTSEGVFGVALGVVATYVFHYVLFGVLATRIGLGKLFIDLANALTGKYAGGPAKVSIFGSALFGMISGSSIANTVTVGSLTIPAMIRLGYQRHFAAAVESTASTGGQITPPIMGAAAFLMVEFLNRPYQQIILAAIVPAFMHFFGVFCQVHFEAKKNGLKGVPANELPRPRDVIRDLWPTSIPLFVLLAVLFSGYTPYLAAFWGITSCLMIAATKRDKFVAVAMFAIIIAGVTFDLLSSGPITIAIIALFLATAAFFLVKADDRKEIIAMMVDAFIVGAKYAIAVGAAAATVGIIVGVVTLTGVGFKLSNIVTSFAGSIAQTLSVVIPAWMFDVKTMTLFFTLVMTAIVCILLGCGVPTTATYIIMVSIAAPALGLLGVEPIVAHFFVFYYGVLADVTPPVALAAYAAASMAGADPFKTGNTAFRLALGKALVPFVFVYGPAMLIVTKGFTWASFWEVTIGCAISVVMLSAALTGYALARITMFERLWLGFAALMVMSPNRTSTLIGLAAAVPILLRQLAARKSETAQAAA